MDDMEWERRANKNMTSNFQNPSHDNPCSVSTMKQNARRRLLGVVMTNVVNLKCQNGAPANVSQFEQKKHLLSWIHITKRSC